jgi:endonuclease VIII
MEGPSLVILREELEQFRHQKVRKVSGNTKQPKESLRGCTLDSIDTWGKQLFLAFASTRRGAAPIVTKTHFLMFGSYRINEPRIGRVPRLELTFKNGIVYFYACSIKFGADEDFQGLDRRVDLMSQGWEEDHVVDLMRRKKHAALCDLFLDQTVFAGSGNIVKNEVLFNIRRHPLTRLVHVSSKDWLKVARAVREYCWNFYEWKKKFELRKHWQVYRQAKCPLCDTKLVRENLGAFQRTTFYCPQHQRLLRRVRNLEVFPVLPIRWLHEAEPPVDH